MFLNKNLAHRHFSQYGRICNFFLRPSKASCIIEYETPDEAEKALLEAGTYNGETFNIGYTIKDSPQHIPFDDIDPDVQYELQAMGSKGTPSNFGSRTILGMFIYKFRNVLCFFFNR